MARTGRYVLLFLAVSFLGWAAETAFFLACYGTWWDRGFLTLPLCPIYGCAFLLVDVLTERAAGKGTCLLLCALTPTALELVTGLVCRGLGLRLWDYSACRFHLAGIICLEYTLLWAVLVPPAMACLYRPLKRRVLALPEPLAGRLAWTLGAAAGVDWLACLAAL